MNGITYFKLKSSYDGDITKNCTLRGVEVDNNFYTLEGRDIKSIKLNDGKIIVKLYNGDTFYTENITEDCIKDISIDFDEENGILTVTQDGMKKQLTGFTTQKNILDTIENIVPQNVSNAVNNALSKLLKLSTDSSLIGKGIPKSPLGVSPTIKTGQYRPVDKIVNILEGEKLPDCGSVEIGDRFLTIEKISDFGYLYNYQGLKKIAAKLKETNSEWRIPTKEDWDDMLNAVEPSDKFKTHSDARSNKFLGKFAGKILKSKEFWKEEEVVTNDCDDSCVDYSDEDNEHNCVCERNSICNPSYCGEFGKCHYKNTHDNSGIDLFGMRILPAGYANGAKDFLYFRERAYFWTATNHDYRDAYIKVFDYNRGKVLQDILASDNYLSVRLVKDYNGNNFMEREDILGNSYSTVMMPSVKNGKTIWTSVNVSIGNCNCCECKHLLPNDGQGIENKTRYFINEWTPKGWLRNELKDGESVVVRQYTSDDSSDNVSDINKNYSEYRVINEQLVDVATLIYNNVIKSIDPITNNLSEQIDDLDEKLEAEITRATETETSLGSKLSEESEEREKADTTIQKNINSLDEKINKNAEDINVNKENISQLTDNVNTLNDKIDTEVTTRSEKDEELETKINEEATARKNTDEILKKSLDEEIQNRKDADKEISESINNIKGIEGQIHVQDGSIFTVSNGILTLKSKDGTNDIQIQFTMDFGEITAE